MPKPLPKLSPPKPQTTLSTKDQHSASKINACHNASLQEDSRCRRGQNATTMDALDTVWCCDHDFFMMEESEVISIAAEESEVACRQHRHGMKTTTNGVSDAACCRSQNATTTDELDAACRGAPDSFNKGGVGGCERGGGGVGGVSQHF